MRTTIDFQRQATARNITWWQMHECSFCGYPCGYVIRGAALFYDSGCYCSTSALRPCEWQNLADHYNLQRDARVIAEMDAFWGFEVGP